MKTLKLSILTLSMTFFAMTCFAQEDFTAKTKGSFLANGSISFNTTSSKQSFEGSDSKANSSGLLAGPKVGYYVMDNLAIGINLEVALTTEKNADDEETKVNSIGFGPFARYHLDNGLFGEISGFIGASKTTFSEPGFEFEQKANSYGLRAGVGYSLFLGDHIAIEPAVFYVYQSSKPKDAIVDIKTTLNTIFLNIGFTAYF